MPDNLLQTGGVGGLGGFLGAVLAALGFKSKIKDLEKRVDRLSDACVYEDTCGERVKRIEGKIDSALIILEELRKK